MIMTCNTSYFSNSLIRLILIKLHNNIAIVCVHIWKIVPYIHVIIFYVTKNFQKWNIELFLLATVIFHKRQKLYNHNNYLIYIINQSLIHTSSSLRSISSSRSFCLATNFSITPNNGGEIALKYLWKSHLTARAAKMLLLTSADLRSVSTPGEYLHESSYRWRVMT